MGSVVPLLSLHFPKLLMGIFRGKRQIVHTHHRKSFSIICIALIIARFWGVSQTKLVHTIHNPKANYGDVYLFLLSRASIDVIIFNSQETCKSFGNLKRDHRVVENGIDVDKIRSFRHSGNKHWDLIWIGRIARQKNFELFVELLKEPALMNKRVIVICDKAESVVDILKRNGLENVEVSSFMPQEEVWQVIAKSKVFVNTSRFEGYGNIIGEAVFLAGKIVLPDIEPLRRLYAEAASFYEPFKDNKDTVPGLKNAIFEPRQLLDQQNGIYQMVDAAEQLQNIYLELANNE